MPEPVPKKAALDGLEDKWSRRWDEQGTYRFRRSAERAGVFSIDTPPPTVSGSLHVGHVFSYTHTDTMARYKRMRGYDVFYPMGWDDNGLATERRVQNYYGVRCDPSLSYVAGFRPPAEGGLRSGEHPVAVSRPNFVELCERLIAEDEKAFEQVWRRLGLSVDWTQHYTTIGPAAQRASQRGFLRLLARGEAYAAEAPTLWDVDFQTAVAQAELEDRELEGTYHRLAFDGPDSAELLVDTTRPELLPACVAIVAHPDDPRYSSLVGRTARTPVFGVEVPVVAHPLAQQDKGTGMAMICTFGDVTDVLWWRELGLPLRAVVGRDGRLTPRAPEGVGARAAALYGSELAGLTIRKAQARVVELLGEAGALRGEPRRVRHSVKFYERGERPLEIVTSRQWFYRTLAHREALLDLGARLSWHPQYMQSRYANWVEGLSSDWLISRQRFFGVPFPIWYPIGSDGEPDLTAPLVPDESALPVDPSTDAPPGFKEEQRGGPGGFMAEPDVMDTWATSSLTPQIAGGWVDDPDLFARVWPMDLRPQAHDIIRTWLFSTVVRSHLEFGRLPWSDAAISGWILDPDRKKMTKSKGNVVTPMGLLETYGSDAVRYWAASARPGTDAVFEEGQMRIGRKLAIKVLNVSRFVLETGASPGASAVKEPLDRAMLGALDLLVAGVTTAFDDFDYARALERTEAFFWSFCDDFVELVKGRAYGAFGPERAASARASLHHALMVTLKLLAPFLPFVTEEVWSWCSDAGSIHLQAWPAGEMGAGGDPSLLEVAGAVLGEVRKAKTAAGVSLRAQVESVQVTASDAKAALVRAASDDLKEAGVIRELSVEGVGSGAETCVHVQLADGVESRV